MAGTRARRPGDDATAAVASERNDTRDGKGGESAAGAPPAQVVAGESDGDAGGDSDDRALSDYEARIVARLKRYKVYPRAARARGLTGRVRLSFHVAADGRVRDATLASGSGSMVLDQAALDMLADASPLPAPPASIARNGLDLTVPVAYRLGAARR